MKGKRCLFPRDEETKRYVERKAEIMFASQFKNACWTGRAAGVAQSSVTGQDVFSLEISRVNLAHSLLYFLHKNLFTQEGRCDTSTFLSCSFVN